MSNPIESRKALSILVLTLIIQISVHGQELFHSPNYEIFRTLRIVGEAGGYSGNFRSYSTNYWETDEESPWTEVLNRHPGILIDKEVELRLSRLAGTFSYNTALPWGVYDAGQWQGRGANLSLDAGLSMKWKGLAITLEGSFWFAENRDFETVPVHDGQSANEYWYYAGGSIDYYQKPTDSPAWGFSPGQSGIRYSGRLWTTGLTTENVWIGPARFFPIMLSDQAAGFPHFDIGTLGFIPMKIGKTDLGLLETRLMLGVLQESDYFDSDSENDFNQLLVITAGYAFPFQKNLRFGFHYLRRKNMLDFPNNFWQVFDPSNGGPTETHNDKVDKQVSFTLDWTFERVGLEIYGEYARNDYSPDLSTYIRRFDKSNGYTLGLEKVFVLKESDILSFTFELSDLFQIPYNEGINEPPWYRHYDVPQGHTNLGQLLGSPIGPGSDSQKLQVQWFNSKTAWNWYLQRVFVDKDYFFALTEETTLNQDDNYAMLVLSARRTRLSKTLDWYVEMSYVLSLNYGWIPDNTYHNAYLGSGFEY